MATPKFAGLSGRSLSHAVSAVATTGFLLFGYDQGVMGGIITAPAFNNLFEATRDNPAMQGTVTAIYEIGCLFGALLILLIGDSLGRRRAIIAGGLIMIVGVIIQVSAQANATPLAQFIIGRVVMGIGNGINTSTIPTYQAECSNVKNRGLLICIEGGVIAFGSLLAYWIDYAASFGNSDLVWRFPIAFQIVFCIIVSGGMWLLPESPRWLLAQERTEEATAVIAALRGWRMDAPETQQEITIIQDSIRASGFFGQKSTPFSALVTGGKTQHLRRMLLGASSQLFQQMSFCNAGIYYFTILYQTSLGSDHSFATLMGGVFMIVYAIFATTSWFIIERVGRRKLFIWGSFGQMVAWTITFACLIPEDGESPAARGAAVGLFLFIAVFGATWLPLPWLYPAEINPLKTRARSNAISTVTNWGFNALVVWVVPSMIANIKWGTYLFAAVMNACFIPAIYFFYPETAGRSLEEIDIIFAKGYFEKISYVKAAKELPPLSPQEVEQEAVKYGLIDSRELDNKLDVSREPINGMDRLRDPEKL